MSLRLRALNLLLRHVEKPRLARVELTEARRQFELQRLLFRTPRGARFREARLGGLPVTWAKVPPTGGGVILYLHGGAHLMGSPRTHRAMLARLSGLTGLPACLPTRRLAPEHPFPAGLDDAEAAWNALVSSGVKPGEVVLGGDSAGGGLMLALLARLLMRGELPAAAFAFSPWTDLTGSGASMTENAMADVLLPVSRIDEARAMYLGRADPADPGVSPLFADFPGCPPVYLQAGTTEILRDDSLRMADRLRSFDADVVMDLTADTPHVVPIFQGWLPEADAVLERTAAFIRQRLRVRQPAGS